MYNTTCLRPIVVREVSFLPPYQFERDFDLIGWREWFGRNWAISVYSSLAYIFVIFALQHNLKNRKPFKLNLPLAIWNAGLTVFSILVFSRTAPEMYMTLRGQNGFHNSVCRWTYHNPATAFWSLAMLLSKLVEFGDTIFIVLRKQNLLFLHWYHHILTLTSSWLMYAAYEPNQLWYIVMNSFVHSIMYFYYFLKAMKVKVPLIFSVCITVIQLVQMVIGVYVNAYAYYVMIYLDKPEECDRGIFGLKVSFWIFSSFLVLFAMFFYDTYLSRRANGKKPKPKLVQAKAEGTKSQSKLD